MHEIKIIQLVRIYALEGKGKAIPVQAMEALRVARG
jgi:hypothetical protein